MNWIQCVALTLFAAFTAVAAAQPVEPVLSLVKKERPALLDTLKTLVEIESGSADREGLDRIASVIEGRLKLLGAKVEFIEPGPDMIRFSNTPAKTGKTVRATLTGKGTKKILL